MAVFPFKIGHLLQDRYLVVSDAWDFEADPPVPEGGFNALSRHQQPYLAPVHILLDPYLQGTDGHQLVQGSERGA